MEEKNLFSFLKNSINIVVSILNSLIGIILYLANILNIIQVIILFLITMIVILSISIFNIYKRYSECINQQSKIRENNQGLRTAKEKYFEENKELKQEYTNLISERNQLLQLLEFKNQTIEIKNQTIDNKNQVLMHLVINLPEKCLPKQNKDFILNKVISNDSNKGVEAHERKQI